MKRQLIYEWWESTKGQGCYHMRIGGDIKMTSQTYSRARDAARQARRDAQRTGGTVRRIERPTKLRKR